MYTKDIQINKAEGLDKYQLPDTSQIDFGSYLTAKDSKPKKEKDTNTTLVLGIMIETTTS